MDYIIRLIILIEESKTKISIKKNVNKSRINNTIDCIYTKKIKKYFLVKIQKKIQGFQ